MTATEITARTSSRRTPHGEILCDIAEYYLAVFDIPDDLLPPDVELDGSIVG